MIEPCLGVVGACIPLMTPVFRSFKTNSSIGKNSYPLSGSGQSDWKQIKNPALAIKSIAASAVSQRSQSSSSPITSTSAKDPSQIEKGTGEWNGGTSNHQTHPVPTYRERLAGGT